MKQLSDILARPRSPRVIMAIGAVASGKTTILEPFCGECGYVRLSPSEIRAQMQLNDQDKKVSQLVWGELHKRVDQALSEGKSVVIDAKNAEGWRRPREVQYYKDHGAVEVIAAFFNVPLEELKERNRQRPVEEQDSEEELLESFDQLRHDPPTLDEGFDEVISVVEAM